jgi:hypothetical protein
LADGNETQSSGLRCLVACTARFTGHEVVLCEGDPIAQGNRATGPGTAFNEAGVGSLQSGETGVATAARQIYSSPNGDRWYLVHDPAADQTFIRHEANIPSGGQITRIGIGDFLAHGNHGPEQQALLRLIGTLAEGP